MCSKQDRIGILFEERKEVNYMDDENRHTYKVKCSFEFEIEAQGQDNAEEIAWDEADGYLKDSIECGKANIIVTKE